MEAEIAIVAACPTSEEAGVAEKRDNWATLSRPRETQLGGCSQRKLRLVMKKVLVDIFAVAKMDT